MVVNARLLNKEIRRAHTCIVCVTKVANIKNTLQKKRVKFCYIQKKSLFSARLQDKSASISLAASLLRRSLRRLIACALF